MSSEKEVRAVLEQFQDPESGRSVVRMEQVRSVEAHGNTIAVTVAFTTWAAPLWQSLREELAALLRSRFPGAEVTVNVDVQHRPPEKLGEVGLAAKSVIAVGSGKGGVGKSTIAASLAVGLARAGAQVGLLDADVYGPSIPHMLGSQQRPHLADERIQPVMIEGLAVMSMGFLVPAGEAVIWRGPMLHGAITQFLRDTNWGNLDYMIIDLPPGTGDVSLSLSQLVPLSGAVVVCTPQDVALLDAVKAITMFRKLNIPVLGMVENMSFFLCPNCQSRHEIFGHGGAQRRAKELDVPFLGDVPLNGQLRILGDEGRVAAGFENPEARPYLQALCQNLVGNLVHARRAAPPMPTLSVLK